MSVKALFASAAAMFATALAIAATPVPKQPAGDLPAGPGREVVIRACGDCHGMDVLQGRHTRGDWQDVVDDMVGRGAPADENDAKAIVNYLVTAFGKVNVNAAPAADLIVVLEVSEAEAVAIIDYRTKSGAFKSFEDLAKVKGLNAARLEDKRDRILFE